VYKVRAGMGEERRERTRTGGTRVRTDEDPKAIVGRASGSGAHVGGEQGFKKLRTGRSGGRRVSN
jgi:hypothetical protein